MGSTHSIATFDHDASFDAYVAAPEGTPKAAIIVIQEIFGVNPGIRQKCDGWAAQGYLARPRAGLSQSVGGGAARHFF